MKNLVSSCLAMPKAAWLLAAAAAGSLGFAFVMQFGFGFEPCVLCLWQRVPFVLATVLALIAALRKPYGKPTRVLLGLCALVLFINSGVATFHTGVERHWWLGTSGCTIEPMSGTNVESFREKLLHTAVARCDEISWTFLGLSMANYNIAFSFALGLFAALAARRAGRDQIKRL